MPLHFDKSASACSIKVIARVASPCLADGEREPARDRPGHGGVRVCPPRDVRFQCGGDSLCERAKVEVERDQAGGGAREEWEDVVGQPLCIEGAPRYGSLRVLRPSREAQGDDVHEPPRNKVGVGLDVRPHGIDNCVEPAAEQLEVDGDRRPPVHRIVLAELLRALEGIVVDALRVAKRPSSSATRVLHDEGEPLDEGRSVGGDGEHVLGYGAEALDLTRGQQCAGQVVPAQHLFGGVTESV